MSRRGAKQPIVFADSAIPPARLSTRSRAPRRQSGRPGPTGRCRQLRASLHEAPPRKFSVRAICAFFPFSPSHPHSLSALRFRRRTFRTGIASTQREQRPSLSQLCDSWPNKGLLPVPPGWVARTRNTNVSLLYDSFPPFLLGTLLRSCAKLRSCEGSFSEGGGAGGPPITLAQAGSLTRHFGASNSPPFFAPPDNTRT